jgi:hypothetical protein
MIPSVYTNLRSNHIDTLIPTIMCQCILISTRRISDVGGSLGHILVIWKWFSQHSMLLCYEPQGFLNFGVQVGKVTIFTKFTGKVHLGLLECLQRKQLPSSI